MNASLLKYTHQCILKMVKKMIKEDDSMMMNSGMLK